MANLYFRQLLAGVDFGCGTPMAAQMANFVYAVGDRDTGECMVIDPAWAVAELVDTLAADEMRVVGALVTHYHPDHCGGDMFGMRVDGLAELAAVAPCKVHCHKLEADGVAQVSGVDRSEIVGHDSGDKVAVGGIEIELLHTPGHTPGSVCFRCNDALLSGDTVFLQGCGRVDLPGGDPDEMFRTLTSRLASLPADTVVFPGHNYGGASATMGQLRTNNQYLQLKDLASWRRVMG